MPDVRGAIRYRLLESLRSYAHERLVRRGVRVNAAAHRRLAEHFASIVAMAAPEITGPDEARWLVWLDTELLNLRAGVHWAVAQHDVDLAVRLFTPLHPWIWCGTARTSEIGRWAALLVGQCAIEGHPAYPAVCEWGFRGATSAGDHGRIHEWLERVTEPTFRPTPITLGCMAYLAMSGDPRQAMASFVRAADLAGDAGDHFTEAALLFFVNGGHRFWALPEDSGDLARRALGAARACGSPTAIAWGLFGFGLTFAAVDRRAAQAAIDELPSAVARCAFPDTNLQHGSDYARGLVRLAHGDISGLQPIRAEIEATAADGRRPTLMFHLLRAADTFVQLDVCRDTAAELIAGVRAQRLSFTSWSEDSADILRGRMGDAAHALAEARGAGSTLDQLVARSLAAIDELLV
jgi:hypothetical protein